MGTSSEAIFSRNPVTFHYKGGTTNTPQFGLIAEEVAKVNPGLILVDKEGKPYSMRYKHINAILLNEFLKEHRAFVEQHHKIARQQEEIDSLNTELQKQRSLIDRVTTKFEASQPATKVASREP
jgi:uncharacterized coiled-coil protein SlyX